MCRDGHLAHRGVPGQSGLDLAELDAKAADFDLVIDPPQAFERAVGPPSREVARTVESTAGHRPERVGDELLGRQTGAIPIAARQPAPPM